MNEFIRRITYRIVRIRQIWIVGQQAGVDLQLLCRCLMGVTSPFARVEDRIGFARLRVPSRIHALKLERLGVAAVLFVWADPQIRILVDDVLRGRANAQSKPQNSTRSVVFRKVEEKKSEQRVDGFKRCSN